MHACWILMCMLLNLLSYASLLNKKVPLRVQSPMVGLKVAYPDLRVVGDVTYIIDLQYFMTLMFFWDLVTSAKNLLGKNVF